MANQFIPIVIGQDIDTGKQQQAPVGAVLVDVDGNPLTTSTFLGLTDTPASYSGQALKGVRVNAGETGVEFGSGATFTTDSALIINSTISTNADDTATASFSAKGTTDQLWLLVAYVRLVLNNQTIRWIIGIPDGIDFDTETTGSGNVATGIVESFMFTASSAQTISARHLFVSQGGFTDVRWRTKLDTSPGNAYTGLIKVSTIGYWEKV